MSVCGNSGNVHCKEGTSKINYSKSKILMFAKCPKADIWQLNEQSVKYWGQGFTSWMSVGSIRIILSKMPEN